LRFCLDFINFLVPPLIVIACNLAHFCHWSRNVVTHRYIIYGSLLYSKFSNYVFSQTPYCRTPRVTLFITWDIFYKTTVKNK
jgi:hypothetical protein